MRIRRWKRREYLLAPLSRVDTIFNPFDIVYEHVTEEMAKVARQENGNWFGHWLNTVISGFKLERGKWTSPDLDEYITLSGDLSPCYLRLAAGAYLHISYDLARVMANNWPPSHTGSQHFMLTIRYREIDPIFATITSSSFSDRRVVGYFLSRVSRFVNTEVLQSVVGDWVDRLRSEAIYNAYKLSTIPNRPYIEERMRKALTAALDHVNAWKPWTFQKLRPFRVSAMMAISPLLLVGGGLFCLSLFLVFNIYYFFMYVDDLRLFANELGRRVSQYVSVAIYDPEALDLYIERRRFEKFENRDRQN